MSGMIWWLRLCNSLGEASPYKVTWLHRLIWVNMAVDNPTPWHHQPSYSWLWPIYRYHVSLCPFKVAEDDIAFKLAIFKKSLHLNDNTCFCSIIQASKLVFGSLLAKNNFFVQFWTKNFASSRMADCGSGLPAEWPFRSQNAIEASDSPLPGGLWVKRLITHALCSLAYSDIAWCKLFLIFTMKCLYWVFFAYKTPYSVLVDNSIHIPEIDTEKTWLTLQGQIFRCIKHLSVSQLKYLYIVSVKYFR